MIGGTNANFVSGAVVPGATFMGPDCLMENAILVQPVLGAVVPGAVFRVADAALENTISVQPVLGAGVPGAINEGEERAVEPEALNQGAGEPVTMMQEKPKGAGIRGVTNVNQALDWVTEGAWWDAMLGVDLTVCATDPVTPSQLGVEEGAPASGQPGTPPLWFHGPSPMVSVASGISPQVPPPLPRSMDTEVRKEFTRGLLKRGSVDTHSYPVGKPISLPGGGMYVRGPSGVAPPELAPPFNHIHVGVDLPWGFLLPSPGRQGASGTPAGVFSKADWRLLVGPVLCTYLAELLVRVGTVSRWYK